VEQLIICEATNRVIRMEQCFEALQTAADNAPGSIHKEASLREFLQALVQYYESGQWLHDYELDEKGLLPHDLKRGVLAQDAVYDFLERIREE